jgi:hypothetical protein
MSGPIIASTEIITVHQVIKGSKVIGTYYHKEAADTAAAAVTPIAGVYPMNALKLADGGVMIIQAAGLFVVNDQP